MNRTSTNPIAVAVFLAALVGALVVPDAHAAGPRWDLAMLEDAEIWTRLLTEYANAEHREAWPRRRAALHGILESHPDSRWADDAALILAAGKASFEDDTKGAIAALEAVIERYPYGSTVVEQWSPDTGCRFDETWLMWAGSLARPGPEGTVVRSRPFGAHGELDHTEREALAYFGELETCPRSTRVMARLLIARIHALAGDDERATQVLEDMVHRSFDYIGIVTSADRAASSKDDGLYLRTLANRPEHQAFLLLLDHYLRQRDPERAADLAARWVETCSPDGWLWQIHRQLGAAFTGADLRHEAHHQYRLALAGLDQFQHDTELRRRFVAGSDIPEEFWKTMRAEITVRLEGKK